MKKVIAFGSFDILHKGHEHYLEEAKSYGEHLIVVVARDRNIIRFKGEKPKHDEDYRLEEVRKLNFVDEAVLGNEDDILKVLEDYNPNVICLGYDQRTIDEEKLKEELKKRSLKTEIIRAKSFKPEIYKSSILKKST